MTIASKKETFKILKEYNLIAKKGYGQNFLINSNIVKNIVKECKISNETLVIEIGPGLGALTEELIKIAPKVIAIEIDKNMVEILKETVLDEKLTIINEDFLKTDLNNLIKENAQYKEVVIVSNLPYYITSDILEKIISLRNLKIKRIVAMMQKEVGKKFLKKEDKIESYLKVLIDNYCETKTITYVSKNDFEPRPKVDSIVLSFELNKDVYEMDVEHLRIIKECLNNRRKTLINTLPFEKEKISDFFNKKNIKSTIRIEELSIAQMLDILKNFL